MKLVLFLIFSLVSLFSGSTGAGAKSSDALFNVSSLDSKAVALTDLLADSQTPVTSRTLETVYFSNLRENFPFNSHGTCGFTAMSMLLSYYDTFCDDWFVDESFDVQSRFDPATSLDNVAAAPFDLSSPGVRSEPFSEVIGLSSEDYMSWCRANASMYLQSFLIDIASDMFGWPISGNAANPFGLQTYKEQSLLNYYNIYKRGLNSGCVVLNVSEGFSSGDEAWDFITDSIESGNPVLLNVTFNPDKTTEWKHSVIAYDYGTTPQLVHDVYVHPGWSSSSGEPLTHVSLVELSEDSHSEAFPRDSWDFAAGCRIDSAIRFEIRSASGQSDNYVTINGESCDADSIIRPHNLRNLSGSFLDTPAAFVWDHLDKDHANSKNYWTWSLRDSNGNVLGASESPLFGEGFVAIETDLWRRLVEEDMGNFYSFAVQMVSEEGRPKDGLSMIVTVEKPSSYSGADVFSAAELGFGSPTSEGMSKSHSIDDLEFSSFKINCGSIGESVVLRSRKAFSRARLEFTFADPILRIDLRSCLSGVQSLRSIDFKVYSKDQEGALTLERNGFDTFERSKPLWRQISLSKLSHCVIFEFFTYPTNPKFSSSSVADVVISDVAVWRKLPTSGGEVPYEPNRWLVADPLIFVNCYMYALNVQCLEDGTVFPSDVGRFGNALVTCNSFDSLNKAICSDFAAVHHLRVEDQLLGRYIKRIDRYDVCPPDMYKIACAYYHDDYHWYRQNPDGYWSHKMGGQAVSDLDFSGNKIVDPLLCDRGSYETFMCYYAIKPFGRLFDEI